MTDLLGPANALNAVTDRPADARVFGSVDTFFKDCSSATARDGTFLGSAFLNGALQQLRRAIRGMGVAVNNSDDDMLLKAIRSSGIRWGVDTGAASVIAAAMAPTVASLSAGLALAVKIAHDTTGPTTLKADDTATTSVVWADGSAVAAGDLKAGGVMFIIYDGAKFQIVNYRPPSAAGVPYNFIGGLTTAWVDATHISVQPGAAAAGSAGMIALTAAITKDISALWAAGSGNGMRSSAAWADGTWHIFAIADPTGANAPDIFADTSLTPALPAGYTLKRRICSLIVSSLSIRRYLQFNRDFFWYSDIDDFSVPNYTSGSIAPFLLTVAVPSGFVVEAFLNVHIVNLGGGASRMSIAQPDGLPMYLPGSWYSPGFSSGGQNGLSEEFNDIVVRTNSSRQVYAAIYSNASTGYGAGIICKGYRDSLN